MRIYSATILGAAIVSLSLGCQAAKRQADVTTQADSTGPLVGQTSRVAVPSVAGVLRKPTPQAPVARDSTPIPNGARVDKTSRPTIARVAAGKIPVGQTVLLTGKCLDKLNVRLDAGPPPVSRSDWQLSDGTSVVFVVGSMPVSCASGATEISGTVAMDSIVTSRGSSPRWFVSINR